MHEYDIALKVLLQSSANSLLRQLTGASVERWENTELPVVQTRRVDLLGWTTENELVHIELQSTNKSDMAARMAEYALRIYLQVGKYPKQIVLYVGEAAMSMDAVIEKPGFSFRYELVDIRDLDADLLLASPRIEDNLLAILMRLPDRAGAVRQILGRIARLEEPARRAAFAQFLIISGLRRLSSSVEEEAEKMPILNDIMDHEVIGPAIRKGLQQGLQQGRQEGRREGRQQGLKEGQQNIVRRQLEKRFGALPERVGKRLEEMSAAELEEISIRIFEAENLESLFSD
jgi:predicted transposase YdaD